MDKFQLNCYCIQFVWLMCNILRHVIDVMDNFVLYWSENCLLCALFLLFWLKMLHICCRPLIIN